MDSALDDGNDVGVVAAALAPEAGAENAAPHPEYQRIPGKRGKNKQTAWRRDKDAPVAVIPLPLDIADQVTRVRVEKLFCAQWSVKRALQRHAAATVAAYYAGHRRRKRDAAGWRSELGLSREGLERYGYQLLERAGHLKHHTSKALVMHQADEVWTGVERHLFGDATGKRAGAPRVGPWWDFTRIPGRAKSHTVDRKWETFRLHGTLQGHLDAYRHPKLPAAVATPADAGRLAPGTRVLQQPRVVPAPERPQGRVETGQATVQGKARTRAATWWDHTGSLTVVFAGGPDSRQGDLVLPVRLPGGAGRWPRILHYLGTPEVWHKVDLVRRRDPGQPGGWSYEAHLMILGPSHTSPATRERRHQAAQLGRRGCVDGNVSNLAIVSAPASLDPADGRVESTLLAPTREEWAALERAQAKRRRRQRALDRSRRATNAAQYQLSKKQARRARRRAEAGLAPKQVPMPRGPRNARANGVPVQAYRRDTLSHGYRENRARLAEQAASQAAAKTCRARELAAQVVAVHGPNLSVEDCTITSWFKRWGRRLQHTTPGRLLAALAAECAAAGGQMRRIGTAHTALSQHCHCGQRVPKALAVRIHQCPGCGLRGDRDLHSAALGLHVEHDAPDQPSTARVNYTSARATQVLFHEGLQEALSESTAPICVRKDADEAAAPSPRKRAGASARRRTRKRVTPGQGDTAASGAPPSGKPGRHAHPTASRQYATSRIT